MPFTPGPWTIEHGESPGQGEWHYWMINGPHKTITSISAAAQRGPIDMGWNQGNAFLISAAPDMHEALMQCLAYIERDEAAHGRQFGEGNVARAALAKASGAN